MGRGLAPSSRTGCFSGREEGAKGLWGAGRGVSGKRRLLDWDGESWLHLLPLPSGFIHAAFAQSPSP